MALADHKTMQGSTRESSSNQATILKITTNLIIWKCSKFVETLNEKYGARKRMNVHELTNPLSYKIEGVFIFGDTSYTLICTYNHPHEIVIVITGNV